MDKKTLTEQFITEILAALRSTKDFVLEQAPDVVQQLVHWEIASRLIWIMAALVLLYAAWYYRSDVKKREVDDPRWREDATQISFTVSIVTGAVGCFVFLGSLNGLVKVCVAPKLFLLQYFTDLLKKG